MTICRTQTYKCKSHQHLQKSTILTYQASLVESILSTSSSKTLTKRKSSNQRKCMCLWTSTRPWPMSILIAQHFLVNLAKKYRHGIIKCLNLGSIHTRRMSRVLNKTSWKTKTGFTTARTKTWMQLYNTRTSNYWLLLMELPIQNPIWQSQAWFLKNITLKINHQSNINKLIKVRKAISPLWLEWTRLGKQIWCCRDQRYQMSRLFIKRGQL